MLHLAMALALSGLLFVAPAAAAQKLPSTQAALPTTPSTPAEILDRIAPSIVQVLPQVTTGSESSAAVGSGVAVVGGIVSTDNVVADGGQAVVVANDGRRSTATVIRRSPMRDLVLLTTDLALPPADLEASSNQHPGDTVLVIGYPRPDALGDATVTVTHGLISALRRDQEGITYVQTDAPMDPGVAGGALVNLRGQLIGVPASARARALGSILVLAQRRCRRCCSKLRPLLRVRRPTMATRMICCRPHPTSGPHGRPLRKSPAHPQAIGRLLDRQLPQSGLSAATLRR